MSKRKRDIPVVPLEQLKMIRKTEGYTHESISEVLNIDRGTYANYENGLQPLPSDILIQLSKILRVSADFILGLDTHLNKGNDEFMKYTGLNETSIETLRKLNIDDKTILQAQGINLSLGGKPITALTRRTIKVLNTLLANPDMFSTFATAFIDYADNSFTQPVHGVTGSDGCTKWLPLTDNEFGLATDKDRPEDNVKINLNEFHTRAIHKNTLDILINEFVTAYHKQNNIPSLKK